jgi:hypothetical protein
MVNSRGGRRPAKSDHSIDTIISIIEGNWEQPVAREIDLGWNAPEAAVNKSLSKPIGTTVYTLMRW